MLNRKPHKSKRFLAFAKKQYGNCAICKKKNGNELHHYGAKGLGQKCTDLKICRVDTNCHKVIQGKRFLAFSREKDLESWVKILEDNSELLCSYIIHLEKTIDALETSKETGEIF